MLPQATEAMQSEEAEEAVLGALITNPDSLPVIAGFLQPSDFFRRTHAQIFEALLRLDQQRKRIDYLSVVQNLKEHKVIDGIGGAAYITSLMTAAPSSADAEIYARMVEDTATARRMGGCAVEIQALAHDMARPIGERVSEAQSKFDAIVNRVAGTDERNLVDIADDFLDDLEKAMNHRGLTGLTSGLADLDRITGGWQAGQLITLAGRPGMGKTAAAVDFMLHACEGGARVGFISQEMVDKDLFMRLACIETGVGFKQAKQGKINTDQWGKLVTSAGEMAKKHGESMFLYDTPNLTPQQLRARALAWKARSGVDMVIVDYMQLMRVPGLENNRVQEISTISRALKNLAMELKIPVIGLSQLNRGVEQRENKRPAASDLRESGQIEQDSDLIIMVYRDVVYKPNTENPNEAEFNVVKHRNGPTGTARVFFDAPSMHFQNGTRRNIDLASTPKVGAIE